MGATPRDEESESSGRQGNVLTDQSQDTEEGPIPGVRTLSRERHGGAQQGQ